MALSPETAREHIRTWTERLRSHPRQANWPAHLFHSADLSNAVEVLARGRLLCRRGLQEIPCDVANQGALWNNPSAHEYVRLYFRPRNNFHLKTEGIKCLGDPYRQDPHMSIPVMLAFDAQAVLTLEGVGFSQGMLSKKREIGFDDEFFRSIDFASVYHDGPLAPDQLRDVQDKRMAEVVVPEELPLQPYLRRVICRTSLERRTLLYRLVCRLGQRASELAPLIRLEQSPESTFFHKSLYLMDVRFRQGELSLSFHSPKDLPASGEYNLEIELLAGGQIVHRERRGVPDTWPGVRIGGFPGLANGIWRIRLEGVLAYEAPIPSETSVVV